MRHPTLILVVLFVFHGWVPPARAEKAVRDLTFAQVGDVALKLDLYLPETGTPAGLIVWVHGGAWRSGSRTNVDLQGLVARGWAIASVDYRLSTVARFPAQIHDIKAAIRFLRAHAGDYGYPAGRLVVAGSSAGAHLAVLAGVSNQHPALEGNLGAYTHVSANVQAIVDLYGATNLTTILAQSTPHGLEVRIPALDLLLGGQPDAQAELAQLASPVFQIDAQDPPLFIMHGDQDNQMPINQSHEILAAYRKLGLPAEFVVLPGAGHGGPAFTTETSLTQIDRFLRQHLPE